MRSIHVTEKGVPGGLELMNDGEERPNGGITGVVRSGDGKTLFVERETNVELWSLEERRIIAKELSAMGGWGREPHVAITHARVYLGLTRFSPGAWNTVGYDIVPLASQDPKTIASAEPVAPGASWGGAYLPSFTMQAAGATLITANELCAVDVWDLAAGRFVRTSTDIVVFRGCYGIELSEDGRSFTSPPGMMRPERIDVASGRTIPLVGPDGPTPPEGARAGLPEGARHVVTSGSTVAWVDREHQVHVGAADGPWPVVGKLYVPPQEEYPSHRDPGPELALSPHGTVVAFRGGPDEAVLVDATSGEALRKVTRVGISGLALARGRRAFVASLDGSIEMLCLPNSVSDGWPPWAHRDGGAHVASPAAPTSPPPAASSDSSGEATAPPTAGHGPADPGGGGATEADAIDASPCQERTLFAPSGGPLYAIDLTRAGSLLAGAIDAGPVYLWSVADGSLRVALRALNDGAFAEAPDGRVELFGAARERLHCRIGPFVFGAELCLERLETPGLLAALLDGRTIEP